MKKSNIWTYTSITLFLTGLILSLAINGYIKDFDKHHTLILSPILLPILGVVIGTYSVAKTTRYMKILSLVALIANLGTAGLIFLVYAFSYWQF